MLGTALGPPSEVRPINAQALGKRSLCACAPIYIVSCFLAHEEAVRHTPHSLSAERALAATLLLLAHVAHNVAAWRQNHNPALLLADGADARSAPLEVRACFRWLIQAIPRGFNRNSHAS
mmetsp:Transcript_42180/g.98435  ORF Transcript_42180/g.98435 Transcript_42180/m.98435 type:complete len:120 (+) Transcript_42180:131-490(+)